MIKRGWTLLLTVLLFSCVICFSAWAAEEEEDQAITYVTLEFSWDKAPKGGDLVGHVYAAMAAANVKSFIDLFIAHTPFSSRSYTCFGWALLCPSWHPTYRPHRSSSTVPRREI